MPMTPIDSALTDTIADMIRSSTTCGCCDNDTNTVELIKRALERTPVDWWPSADVVPDFFVGHTGYREIRQALIERRVTWL